MKNRGKNSEIWETVFGKTVFGKNVFGKNWKRQRLKFYVEATQSQSFP